MNIVIALIAFLVLSLIVWAVAELNYKHFSYKEDKPEHEDPTAHSNPYGREMNIRDIMHDNSTKGYKAV